MVSKPETLHKAKPLYAYFHKYECQFGELSQISKLEDRMAELFPEDPRLSYFTARYSSEKFDPVAAPIIISKAVQMRPKLVVPTIEQQPASGRNSPLPPTGPAAMVAARPPTAQHRESPRPQYARATASPKRPLGAMDDEELNPPKRLARGASPLKGAAGRRLDQQRRNQASALHRDINFLLTILPPAHTYDGQMLNAVGLTNLLRDTPLPESAAAWSAKLGQQQQQSRQTTPGGGPGHGRQTSADYGGSRPISPYGRLQSAGGYRNSPLGYGPPPPTGPAADSNGGQWGASGGYGQYGGYRY